MTLVMFRLRSGSGRCGAFRRRRLRRCAIAVRRKLAYTAGVAKATGGELLNQAIERARETHRLGWREIAVAIGDGDDQAAVDRLMDRQAKRRQAAGD